MPFFGKMEYDLCAFTGSLGKNSSNLLKTYLDHILPNFTTLYKEMLRPCPYEVSLLFSCLRLCFENILNIFLTRELLDLHW
jgi:hypothetical protein